MSAATTLVDYYAQRAAEYERVYEKPERQADLATLRTMLRNELAGQDVLEVACGTGYWTQVISSTANSVRAVDINPAVLELARAKNYPRRNVTFEEQDTYQLSLAGHFTAGLAAFWWSHIPKSELSSFLGQFHRTLGPGALVVFIDNRFVPGNSTPLARWDDEGNSYQLRTLANGTRHEVLKNFPSEQELRNVLRDVAVSLEYQPLEYYWHIAYRTPID
jgi:SAM-dependent methyltransferase